MKELEVIHDEPRIADWLEEFKAKNNLYYKTKLKGWHDSRASTTLGHHTKAGGDTRRHRKEHWMWSVQCTELHWFLVGKLQGFKDRGWWTGVTSAGTEKQGTGAEGCGRLTGKVFTEGEIDWWAR